MAHNRRILFTYYAFILIILQLKKTATVIGSYDYYYVYPKAFNKGFCTIVSFLEYCFSQSSHLQGAEANIHSGIKKKSLFFCRNQNLFYLLCLLDSTIGHHRYVV